MARPTEPLRRHERSIMLVTNALVLLAVDIWVYQQKGLTCCLETRAQLGCNADPAAPCRGFAGDCGALREQFASVPELAAALGGDAASCHAFPDDEDMSHQVVLAALLGIQRLCAGGTAFGRGTRSAIVAAVVVSVLVSHALAAIYAVSPFGDAEQYVEADGWIGTYLPRLRAGHDW